MTKQRIGALLLTLVLMMGLQHYGLEREPETVSEAPLALIRLQWWRDARAPAEPVPYLLAPVVNACFSDVFRPSP